MSTERYPPEALQALALEVGADPASLTGALLDTLDRMGALWSVKDVASGRYLLASRAMAEAFGRAPDALMRLSDVDLMDAAKAAAIRAAEQAALSSAAPAPCEHRLDSPGGKREFRVVRTAIARADGAAPRHLLSVWLESTEQHHREEQLALALAQLERQQASAAAQAAELREPTGVDTMLRDGATGLYHPLHFDDQLRREVDLSSREHREFALVAIAIDPFSETARALGHGAEGRVLEALGQLLRSNTRAMDASCRLDEDRFAILLSGVGLATAHSRMEGLRRQCATQIVVLEGHDFGFTVSMGVASFPHTAHTEEALLGAAGAALAEAQRRGGNHVALASIRFEPAI